jgi:uncharacterized protein YndB with AHSA1/START domain
MADNSSATPSPAPSDESFTLTRTFDAPRELVFKVWTEAEHLKHWWGPKGMTMLVTRLDLRPGGMFHYSMRTPDGREMWGRFIFREIVPPERIVFVSAFADEHGNAIPSPFLPDWPLEVLNTLLFSEQDGKATLTMRGSPLNASDVQRKAFGSAHASLRGGFKGTFDQLDEYLARVQA